MNIIAIDPGTTTSGVVTYSSAGDSWHFWPKVPNETLLVNLRGEAHDPSYWNIQATLLIEKFAAQGMAIGNESIETCFWTGRFREAWESRGGVVELILRRDVKLHHCGVVKAKDANVRQAMLDKYPAGNKKEPGPLYGCTSHAMQAAAIAAYWLETKGTHETR